MFFPVLESLPKGNTLRKIKTTVLYLSRWRIEEYFRFKKQEFDFENFRVRDLKTINNLNQLLTYTLGFIGMLADKIGRNNFSNKMIKNSNSLSSKVLYYCYQIERGIEKTFFKDLFCELIFSYLLRYKSLNNH